MAVSSIMRPLFERVLRDYQELVRDEAGASDPRVERDFASVREWRLQREGLRTGSGTQVQQNVYALQREKNALMTGLKSELRQIEDGAGLFEKGPGALPVRHVDGRLLVVWRGEERPVTIGQMVADIGWGIRYRLDPGSVPARVQKRYAVELAREQLWHLMERQMVLYEQGDRRAPKFLRNGIGAIVANGHREGFSSERIGFLAEHMVFELMKRLEIDTGTAFRVHRADPYQDVVQKIDFLVSVPDWLRGIKVDTKDGASLGPREGLQITTGAKKAAKRRAVEESVQRLSREDRIRDIRVLSIPKGPLERAYGEWLEAGRPPGGPCANLTSVEAGSIVGAVLSSLVEPSEMERVQAYVRMHQPEGPEETCSEAKPIEGRKSGEAKRVPTADDRTWTRSEVYALRKRMGDLIRLGMDLFPGKTLAAVPRPDTATLAAQVRRALDEYGELMDGPTPLAQLDDGARRGFEAIYRSAGSALRRLERYLFVYDLLSELFFDVAPLPASDPRAFKKLLPRDMRQHLGSFSWCLEKDRANHRSVVLAKKGLSWHADQVADGVNSLMERIIASGGDTVIMVGKRLCAVILVGAYLADLAGSSVSDAARQRRLAA